MGRSNGKRLSFSKPRNVLLGGSTNSFNQEAVYEPVITGELKQLIDSRLDRGLTRKEFYQGILSSLKDLDEKSLLKDLMFFKILDQENKFLGQENGHLLSSNQLKDLASRFLFDLKNHSGPNLGRVVFTDRNNSNKFREEFLNSYFIKLDSIVSQKEYIRFALKTIFPLSESKKDYHGEVIARLAEEMTKRVSLRSVAESSLGFIDPSLADFLKRDERYKMDHYLKASFLSNRFNSQQLTVEDIEEVICSVKKSAFLQGVFSQLLADEMIPGTGNKSNQDLNKHEHIAFLNQVIASGVSSGQVLNRVYGLISEDSETDSKAIEDILSTKELSGESIYNLLADLAASSRSHPAGQSTYKSSLINLFVSASGSELTKTRLAVNCQF